MADEQTKSVETKPKGLTEAQQKRVREMASAKA